MKCIFKTRQERAARFPKDACYGCKKFDFNDGLALCKKMTEENLREGERKK